MNLVRANKNMEDYTSLITALGIDGQISGNELHAHCPFHADNNPSFSINTRTGRGICFAGCWSGDFIDLVRQIMDCTLREAMAWIREHQSAGTEILQKQLAEPTPEIVVEESMPDWRLHYESLSVTEMPKWLFNRGFTWPMVERWGLRYDQLYSQLVIPAYGDDGELLGTIVRNSDSVLPKYRNSPGMHKSAFLYGLPKDWQNTIVLVEGPLDAIWICEAKYCAKAILGAMLSIKQVSVLLQHGAERIVLWFDADEAGYKVEEQSRRILERYFTWGQLFRADAPAYRKDPQECTFEEVRLGIEEAHNLMEI